MRKQEQEEFINLMEQSFQEILSKSSLEDMRQSMADQATMFREIGMQNNPQSYLKDGLEKLRIIESKE